MTLPLANMSSSNPCIASLRVSRSLQLRPALNLPEEDPADASLTAEARFEASGMSRLFRDPGEKNRELHKQFGLDRWYSVEAGSAKEAFAAAKMILGNVAHSTIFTSLQQEPEIVMLEKEVQMATPNDPSYRQQPHYTGSPVDMQAAWGVSTGSNDVVVAVTDSGMDMSHPDLQINKYAQGPPWPHL